MWIVAKKKAFHTKIVRERVQFNINKKWCEIEMKKIVYLVRLRMQYEQIVRLRNENSAKKHFFPINLDFLLIKTKLEVSPFRKNIMETLMFKKIVFLFLDK